MWSRHRAEAAHRELLALGAGLSDVDEIHAAGLSIIRTVVPYDAACVGAVDPDTLLLTSGVTIGFDPSADESDRFIQIEYGALDRHSFSNLVDQGVAVAHSGDVAPSRRDGVRFNELTKLMGFSHDLRMTFTVDGTCWAVGDLYRVRRRHRLRTRVRSSSWSRPPPCWPGPPVRRYSSERRRSTLRPSGRQSSWSAGTAGSHP